MKRKITISLLMILSVTFLVAQEEVPNFTIKVNKIAGEQYDIRTNVHSSAPAASIKVDWGDGEIRTHTVSKTGTLTLLRRTLTVDNPTIKVWSDYIVNFTSYSQKISSIEIGENPRLSRLDIYNNELTELDLNELPNLGWIICFNNNLDVCAVENTYKTLYDRKDVLHTTTGEPVPGKLFIVDTRDEYPLNNVVANESKISIAEGRTWIVCDQRLGQNEPLAESFTASGCTETSVGYANKTVFEYMYNSLDKTLNVKLEKSSPVALYDISGKLSYFSDVDSNDLTINVSNLSRGVYFLKADDVVEKILIY